MTDGYVWLGMTDGSDTLLSVTTYPSDSTQGDLLYASADHTISSLAKNTSATRYLSNTGTSNAPAWAQVALSTGVSGQLPLANGGTAANLTASNGGIFYSTSSAGAILSGTAKANQVLLSGASAAPTWSTATYPATTTANQILYSSAANTITGIATSNNRVLVTSGSGVPSFGNSVATDFSVTLAGSGTRFLRAQNTDTATTTAHAAAGATTGGAGGGDPMLQVAVSGVTTWTMGIDNSVTTPAADPFVISQGTALGTNDVMQITTAGSVLKPLQPAFFAYLSATATDVTGDSTVYTLALNTELFDQQNNFDTTTYNFTAPITGKYMVTVVTSLQQLSSSHTLVESKLVVSGTSANTYILFSLSGTARDVNNNMIMTNSLFIPMTATDTFTVTVQANGGTKVVDVFGGVTGTSVSAYLVC